jgi:hypothetical protein
MNPVDYATLRQKDWYEDVERDLEIEDPRFWCMEQLYIFKDNYELMKKPVRPMQPIDLNHLTSKGYFDDVVWVTSQMGLHHLMALRCD